MTSCTNSKPGCKDLGSSAYGYWGRSVYKRLAQEQEFARQRALLQDQIEGAGIAVDLWRGVTSGQKCACYKESNRSSDRKCRTCHGVIDGYVPGYLKFGYRTFWMSVVDTDITLTNLEVVTEFKSAKAGLVSGALSGSIESSDKAFNRIALGSFWEYEEVSFVRISGFSNVVVEYSLDSGMTWKTIDQLSTENPTLGNIRFKATLTRDSVDILTPFFEIVRARYATVDLSDPRGNGNYTYGPFIRIMSTKPFKSVLKSEYGDIPNTQGFNFWTSGLSMFDDSIPIGSTYELLQGSNTIIEFKEGALEGKRFILLNWKLDDPGAYIIVTQTFNLREEDPVGPQSLVW